jgi:hypothetical protein
LDNNEKKSKEELLEELENLRKVAEEQNEYKKEKLFFFHAFQTYQNSNKAIFISFIINIVFYLINYGNLMEKGPFSTCLFVMFTSIMTNISIALFRCWMNKEILNKFRKISITLSIELILIVIVSMFSFVFL